jgi:hypothetical protein
MKWAWGTFAALVFTAFASAFISPTKFYGRVQAVQPETPQDPLAIVTIGSWMEKSLPTDVDSALEFVKHSQMLLLYVPPCDGVDSSIVKTIAGRFTPFNLSRLNKSGQKQWFGPLMVRLSDSTHCPIFARLRERRWTEVLIGPDADVNDGYTELLRRYKRERVDRLEEMFQK